MTMDILFIHGAGQGTYEDSKKLVANLQQNTGPEYQIHYPAMPNEEEAPYELWKQCIRTELTALKEPAILVAHSVGGSVLIKYLGEMGIEKPIAAIFLLATPFWGGDGWLYDGYEELALPEGFTARIPEDLPIFLYHCHDDEIVPFEHLALYAQFLPHATVRQREEGGHLFNYYLLDVAKDIQNLPS